MPRKASVSVEQIASAAISILNKKKDTMRYSELVGEVKKILPRVNDNTLGWKITYLNATHPDDVVKVGRGLFKSKKAQTEDETNLEEKPKGKKEKNFYESFANYLIGIGDCTKAMDIGDRRKGVKWANPDVIGIYDFGERDILRNSFEFTAAEIKTETTIGGLLEGFGQACSYRLFCHKSYLVIPYRDPKQKDFEDFMDRLDNLCGIFGIGLITFDSNNHDKPNYTIKRRALKNEPDLSYENEFWNNYFEELKNHKVEDAKS